MRISESDFSELKNVNYEIFLVAITVVYLINIPLSRLAPMPEMAQVIGLIDTGFFIIFICDFLYRLATANKKTTYFVREYGWLDLLGSLPISGVRLARGVRSVRTIRLLRHFGTKNMGSELRQDRAGSTLILVFFMGILVLELGSYFILFAEAASANANIQTASDALWWSIVTIATIGYGDKYPVTDDGRVIGVFVIITGVGLFSAFTGYLANSFVTRRKQRIRSKMQSSESHDEQVAELKRLWEEQGRIIAAIEDRIAASQPGEPAPREEPPSKKVS
jgi:voltage-gated potassium channel